MVHQAGAAGAVGIEIALAICVGYFGGRYLDGKLGTTPWLTWTLLLCGVGAAVKALARVIRQYKKQLDQEDHAKEPPREH